MFMPRRLIAASIVTAGLVGFTAFPAFAADTPSATPSPTPTTSATPTTSPTTTPTPVATRAKKAARNISITYVSKTVARLTWSDPSDKGATETVHYYVRTTFSLGGSAQAARVINDTTAHSVTYRNVQPGSMLTPEVTTKYRKAQGKADKGSAYTQNQVAPSKPTGVTATVKNSKNVKTKPSLTVTFKAPSTSGANGTLIDGYRVRLYDSTTNKVLKTETLGKTDRGADFAGLATSHGYYAQVTAHNSAGYGSAGQSATVTTGAAPKPTPTPTPTPTATLLVTIPLPPVPTPTPVVTPKPSATVAASPTAVPTATTPVTPTTKPSKASSPGAFTNANDTHWFTVSLIVAISLGVLLSVGTFLYYRRHPRN